MKMMLQRHLFTLALAALCFLAGPQARAANHTVEIRNFAFNPATVTIQTGDTVTWIQRDFMEHTSTSGENGVPDGRWDSGDLSDGQSFSHTFDSPGSFAYYCTPHPFMIGRVVVQAPAEPPAVRITSPANNTVLPAPGRVTIEATAEAPGASVARVEFFSGTTLLGTDDTAPYSITIDLAAGPHALTATVTSSSGTTANSEPVQVTVSAGGTRIENPIAAVIAKGDLTIELDVVADGLISPLGLAAPDDGSGRLFVYDQAGLVYVVSNGIKLQDPLLDVRERLVPLGDYEERGLLGLAVHPNFADNPFLYTYTSEPIGPAADFTTVLPDGATNNHQSVIAEWRMDTTDSNRVDISSRREILRIDQPQSNHNGGTLHFGPDGSLYIGLGDGGSADDQGNGHVPGGNGQTLENVYGKILRIDVRGRTSSNGQYAVPSDNPFVGQPGLDEIYAYGFRNPYTFSFDRLTGELFCADVGQNQVEELDRVFSGGNYGWPVKEGGFHFDPNGSESGFVTSTPVSSVPANLVDPIAQYDHDDGFAIVGGFVYRGTQLPGLTGRYLSGDWGDFENPSGRLFYLDRTEFKELRIGADNRPLGLWLKGFGQDTAGELYVFGSTDLGPRGTSGRLLKIVPGPALQITGMAKSGPQAVVRWSGGSGPFVIQSREQIGADDWQTLSFTGLTSAEVPTDGPAEFFRIAPMSGNPPIPFTVWLAGANERPTPVETAATGSGILSLEGNALHFNVRYAGLSGVAMAAHIHGPARASESAGVQLDLAPYNDGGFGTSGTLSGSVTLTPEQKAMILAGQSYINIHTPAHGGGEIRGQIAPAGLVASLSGAAERPQPVATAGTGSGVFLLNGNQLSFNITYDGLSGAAAAAHIHGPATTDESAGVLINLQPHSLGDLGARGTFAGTVTLTPEQLAHVLDGLTYVNVHSAAHGGGEIRGQIRPAATAQPFSTVLTGAAERPNAVETEGTGTGYLLLEGNRLRFQVSYSGLSGPAAAAHIHGPARASETAGVLIDLATYAHGDLSTAGTFSGSVLLSDTQRALVQQGLTYVNIHTAANGGGEIRGQVSPILLHAVLLGASERPQAVQSSGTGTGHFLLLGNELTLNITYRRLSSTAVAAHIHGPAGRAGSAGVIVNLQGLNGGAFAPSGSLAGSQPLTAEQLAALLDGLTYVNIHTEPYPGGEIRGQIVP